MQQLKLLNKRKKIEVLSYFKRFDWIQTNFYLDKTDLNKNMF